MEVGRGGGHRGIGVHVKETQKCSSNPKNPPNFFETPNPPTFLPHQPFYPPTFLPTNVCWMTVYENVLCFPSDVGACHLQGHGGNPDFYSLQLILIIRPEKGKIIFVERSLCGKGREIGGIRRIVCMLKNWLVLSVLLWLLFFCRKKHFSLMLTAKGNDKQDCIKLC